MLLKLHVIYRIDIDRSIWCVLMLLRYRRRPWNKCAAHSVFYLDDSLVPIGDRQMEKITNQAGELGTGKEEERSPEEMRAKERRDSFQRKLQRAQENGLGEKPVTDSATTDDDTYVDVLERFGIKI